MRCSKQATSQVSSVVKTHTITLIPLGDVTSFLLHHPDKPRHCNYGRHFCQPAFRIAMFGCKYLAKHEKLKKAALQVWFVEIFIDLAPDLGSLNWADLPVIDPGLVKRL